MKIKHLIWIPFVGMYFEYKYTISLELNDVAFYGSAIWQAMCICSIIFIGILQLIH